MNRTITAASLHRSDETLLAAFYGGDDDALDVLADRLRPVVARWVDEGPRVRGALIEAWLAFYDTLASFDPQAGSFRDELQRNVSLRLVALDEMAALARLRSTLCDALSEGDTDTALKTLVAICG